MISGGFREKVFSNKCDVNKSNRGKDREMEMWREEEGKVKEREGRGREEKVVAQLRLTLMRSLCDGT